MVLRKGGGGRMVGSHVMEGEEENSRKIGIKMRLGWGGRLLGPWEMRQGVGMGCPDRVGDGLGEQWGGGGQVAGLL